MTEVSVSWLKYTLYVAAWIKENHENIRLAGLWAEIWIGELPNTKREF
jgi:hypothetical protein